MQVGVKYLCIAALLFSGIMLMAEPQRRPVFTPVDVKFHLQNPPRYKSGAVSSSNRGNLQLNNRKWGIVEIEYTPRFGFEKGNGKISKNLSGVWIDEVTCGVRLLVLSNNRRNTSALALFSTRVDFWTIPADGKEHRYLVYLPPQLVDRIMPDTSGGNAKVVEAKNIVVSVVFFNKNWGVIGEGYYGLKGSRAGEDFKALLKTVPGQNVFHGALLSRANSPWSVISMEQFDLEKPVIIPSPLDEAAIDKAAEAAAKEESSTAPENERRSKSGKSKKNRKSRR